jgi:hypothetical protein
MTDLRLTILAELRAGALRTSAGRMRANFSFWRAGGRIVLAQLFPYGSYEVKP